MFRIIFAMVMILHGLLRLIGSSKEWNVGLHGQFTGKTFLELSGTSSRIAGTLWLLAAALFLTAAICYLLRKEWFWIPAAVALLLSQTLIIFYWQDAKYGTLVNIVIFILVILSANALHFNAMAEREVKALMAHAHTRERIITEEMIAPLPQNVQYWMRQSNVVGRKTPACMRVTQQGGMRTTPDGRWMPFQSVQYFSIDPPGFIWIAKIKAHTFLEIGGRDKYYEGHGNMLIKPLYLFNAANSSGKEIDQGTLLRYMAEMAWFPQAAVSPYLKWESVSDYQARVTMEYEGVSASGTYTFNDKGEVAGFEARRYGEFGGIFRKETWAVSVTGYKTFNGTRIGHTNKVTWKLQEGDFHWLTMEVTGIKLVASHGL